MHSLTKWIGNRKLERFCLLLITAIMGLVFWKLFAVLQRDFGDVTSRIENGTMINLNAGNIKENMAGLLAKGQYFEDPKDIAFIASTITSAGDSSQQLDNAGELNKKKYFVTADEAFTNGGKSFKRRVQLSRNLLGFAEADSLTYDREKKHPMAVGSQTDAALGNLKISGIIKDQQGNPVAGALARLKAAALADSNAVSDESEEQANIIQFKDGVRKIFIRDSAKNKKLISFNAYARTDASGKFMFTGLPGNHSYEILPLHPGFEFGRSQGIENQKADANFKFVQAPHSMRLFSAKDFNNFKKEKAFIVRTPEEVTNWFWIIVITFFASFLVLHLVLSIRFPDADQLLLPVIMILTGLSFVTLFSLQDPLRDRFLAKSTFIYFCIGMTGILISQFINIRRFTTDSGFFRLFIFKAQRTAANGWPWALGAIGLLFLTIMFGTGPEGSGVKVNLFGFQPSEIVKYMVIIFLAGFFATNEKFISEYPSWNRRMGFFVLAVFAIVVTILSFLLLGDLGPAMVCCFTFIVLFSFSRGDFPQVVSAMILYALCLWIFHNTWIATGAAVAALLLYMIVAKRQLSESAVMSLVVVSGFLLLDKNPLTTTNDKIGRAHV